MHRFLLLALVTLAIGLGRPASAGITFEFQFNDGVDAGFNSVAEGAARRAALQRAAQNYSAAFSSYNATVVMGVTGTAQGDTLASAGSKSGPDFLPGFGMSEVVRNKVLSNNAIDLNGADVDGTVSVNFATTTWGLDINTAPSGGQYDWYSTLYHEFSHAFGFASSIFTNADGSNSRDSLDNKGTAEFGAFDQFLTDAGGNSVFVSGSDLNETTYEGLLVGGNSAEGKGLFFNGANAVAANGGNPVGLFSAETFRLGSSGSHLDDENGAMAGLLMLSSTGSGLGARTFSAIELGMFKDIGYANIQQISAVPEPSSFALVAFCGAGLLVRRRRAKRLVG